MKDCMKSCIRENNPNHLINSKIKKQKVLQSQSCLWQSKLDVSISSIIPCNDNWNNKVMEVNSYLTDLCESNDILLSVTQPSTTKNI